MDFKKVNEKLQKLLELFQINEMTIKDQPCFGEADNIMDAVEKLKTLRRGSFIIPDKLRIKKRNNTRRYRLWLCFSNTQRLCCGN